MKLYRTGKGYFVEQDGHFFALKERSLDDLLAMSNLQEYLLSTVERGESSDQFSESESLPPVGNQEVWASGVTYYRSRTARIEESEGGGSFYDRVYVAERPELFFKALGYKVSGHQGDVRIRTDATWSVPEPELTLVVNPRGKIVGYTVGNDMSSRDIEGQNPLYLPQAKVYDQSCALGPAILVTSDSLPASTTIQLEILRSGQTVFSGSTTLAELKRDPKTLVEYLFRDNTFSFGCFLLTGTGIVPPDDFTLNAGDITRISIAGVGTLENTVVQG